MFLFLVEFSLSYCTPFNRRCFFPVLLAGVRPGRGLLSHAGDLHRHAAGVCRAGS